MNRFELMPVLPFALAYILGIISCLVVGGLNPWIALFAILLFSILAFVLKNNEKYRGYPLLALMLFFGILMTQFNKTREKVDNEYVATTNSFINKTHLIRERILDEIHDEGLVSAEYSIVAAMAFGDKSSLDSDIRENYSIAGTSHLLALSGMHLSILFVLLSFMFSPLKLLGRALVLIAVWNYVVLVGMPPSVIRAAIMLTIYSVCTIDGRNKMSINALCFAALVMLIINPLQIRNISFQLSFLSLIAIFLYTTPIYNILGQKWLFNHPVLRKIWSMIAVSVAAQIGTAPLVAFYFHRFSCYFFVSNIIAIPLVTIMLYLVCMFVLVWFIPAVKIFCLKLIFLVAYCLNVFIAFMASLKGASIENISINWIQLMLIYMIIIALTILLWRIRKVYVSSHKEDYSILK